MKKILLVLAVVTALSGIAFAFEVRVADQTFVVSAGGSKEIGIEMQSSSDERINVDMIDEMPWMTLSTAQLNITKNEPKNITLYISPYHTTSPGLYKVTISAESALSKEKKLKDIFISVTRGEGVEIEKIEVAGDLEPLGTAYIRFIIENLGSVAVNDLELFYTIDSPSALISETKETLNLEPEERVVIEKTHKFVAAEEAGDYVIKAQLLQNSKLLDTLEQVFTLPRKAIIRQTLDERTSLFRKTWKIVITNYGNAVADSTTITSRIGKFESYFYAGTTPTAIDNDIYIWDVRNINPGETRVVFYTLDFTSFYLFIAAAVLLVWFFFVKLRAIRIRKFIMQKKLIEEGEEFTVGLEVTNKTGSTVEEVTVKDIVPLVFDVRDTEGPKPTGKKTGSGTELAWKLRDINNEEVRILTYKIIPTFGVQGKVRLPRAQVSYHGRRKGGEILSGIATIGIEPQEEAETKLHQRVRRRVKRHVNRLKKAVRKR